MKTTTTTMMITSYPQFITAVVTVIVKDNVYGAVIVAPPLQEFTRFI